MKTLLSYFFTVCLVMGIFTLLADNTSATAPARNLAQQTVLHPRADYLTTGWVDSSGNSSYWDELLTNDANTTYIYSTGTYQFYSPTMTTFIDPGFPNETFEITAWVIERHSPGPLVPQIGIRSTTASLYTGSFIMRSGSTTTNTWKNLTITTTKCPATNTNWTVAQINSYHCVISSSAPTEIVTEFAMLINVTIPVTLTTSTDYNLIILGVSICTIMAAILVLTILKRK